MEDFYPFSWHLETQQLLGTAKQSRPDRRRRSAGESTVKTNHLRLTSLAFMRLVSGDDRASGPPYLHSVHCHQILAPIKTWRFMTFKLDRAPHFVIEDIWISMLTRCVTLNGGRTRISRRSKEHLSPTFLLTEQLLHKKEYYFQCFQSSRVIIFRFNGKTQWQMFLLPNGRHVGALRKGANKASPFKAI